jgi:AcrR family transcriptional regulator
MNEDTLNRSSMSERRRDFVRLEIERAGMDLFAERGYTAVTVEDISVAAGIGRRTFFRHFQSKDELLHSYDTRLMFRVLHALQRRPSSEPAALALCRAMISTAEMTPDEERIAFQRNKVILEARPDGFIVNSVEATDALLENISARLGVDPATVERPHVLIWTVMAAARAATRFWIATGGTDSLQHHLEGAFVFLLEGLGGSEDPGATSRSGGIRPTEEKDSS